MHSNIKIHNIGKSEEVWKLRVITVKTSLVLLTSFRMVFFVWCFIENDKSMHYENKPKISNKFHSFAHHIDCGYSLESPR